MKKSVSLLFFISLFFGGVIWAKKNNLPCPLDPLLDAPECWEMTPEVFEKTFTTGKTEMFRWLTKDRTRAKISRSLYGNVVIDLTMQEEQVPVQEAIIDFADGKLNLVTVSIYNRGDGGTISAEVFEERFKLTGRAVGEILQTSPRHRDADSKDGLQTAGFSWYSQKIGVALLEHNEGALKGSEREFLRLRMARPRATGALAVSMMSTRGTTVRLSDLPKNVTEEGNGDVFIDHFPMVDQGNKGYCVVASAQRVFEYYGMGADMHQIAQIADADPDTGTNTLTMAKELDKIDFLFKTRLAILGMSDGKRLTEVDVKKGKYYIGDPVDERKFLKGIHKYVDQGIPLLWSLELGLYPEKPNLRPQTSGGHMRMIIGYNDDTQDIIFSDSWGAGHERKKMRMYDAYRATKGLFVLKPTVY